MGRDKASNQLKDYASTNKVCVCNYLVWTVKQCIACNLRDFVLLNKHILWKIKLVSLIAEILTKYLKILHNW